MQRTFFSLVLLLSATFPFSLGLGGALHGGMEDAMAIQREQLERMRDFLGPIPEPAVSKRQQASTVTFSNPAAEQFFVDGTTIPDGADELYS